MDAIDVGWTALRRVVARPRVLASLAAINVVTAFLAAQPLATALAPLLDNRPATTQLLAGPDDGLAAQLIIDHPELLQVAAASLLLAMIAHALVSAVAAGVALAAWGPSETRGAGALVEAAARHAGRRLMVGAGFLPLRAVAVTLALFAWYALERLARGHGYVALALAAATAALLLGVMWSFTTVTLDYALARTRDLAGGLAADDGLLQARGRPRPTLRLMAFSAGGFVAVTAAYHLAAACLPLLPAASFLLLLILRLALAGARTAVTAATLVAAASSVRRS